MYGIVVKSELGPAQPDTDFITLTCTIVNVSYAARDTSSSSTRGNCFDEYTYTALTSETPPVAFTHEESRPRLVPGRYSTAQNACNTNYYPLQPASHKLGEKIDAWRAASASMSAELQRVYSCPDPSCYTLAEPTETVKTRTTEGNTMIGCGVALCVIFVLCSAFFVRRDMALNRVEGEEYDTQEDTKLTAKEQTSVP